MLGKLTNEEIEDVLHAQLIGRIGCIDAGRPYVVPVTYTYDGESIYVHSGEGMKLRALRANPVACFEVEQIDDFARWRSVVAWGSFEELEGVDAEAAMRLLVARFMPFLTSETARPTHGLGAEVVHGSGAGGRKVVLYRIRLTEKTGRYERR